MLLYIEYWILLFVLLFQRTEEISVVDSLPEGHLIKGSTGNHYLVQASPLSCQCPDWQKMEMPCKHILLCCMQGLLSGLCFYNVNLSVPHWPMQSSEHSADDVLQHPTWILDAQVIASERQDEVCQPNTLGLEHQAKSTSVSTADDLVLQEVPCPALTVSEAKEMPFGITKRQKHRRPKVIFCLIAPCSISYSIDNFILHDHLAVLAYAINLFYSCSRILDHWAGQGSVKR